MKRYRLATTSLALALGAALAAVPADATHLDSAPPTHESAQVVLDWERIAFSTVYPANPVPSGVPILGFTSMAMYDAATASTREEHSSEAAAVAAAAHDVLAHYQPAAQPTLDGQLAATLAAVPDGPAQDTGVLIGQTAAAEMIARRAGDGYGDTSIHYTLPPGVGIWQPTPPATDMLVPWLGSVRPLVLSRTVWVDGPDPVTSADYAADYNEVKALGSANSTERTQAQTDTALFFNSNSAIMVSDATVRYLEANPIGLVRTAKLFARAHASMTDSVIRCWQLKRDVGFWRPFQAVAGADGDGNPETASEAGWASLLPTPPYSDYVTGHGCLTGSAVAVVRRMLGEDTPLELVSTNFPGQPRTYPNLTALEYDAFHARIWGGLHFRDAMEDGYRIAHRTARQVMARVE
jgi:hypothetical protein